MAGKTLRLEGGKDLGSDAFLDQREQSVICVAGNGFVAVDGKDHPMKKGGGLYVRKGVKEAFFVHCRRSGVYRVSHGVHLH
ncbi:MAG: hypothetical protein LBL45_03480 [Treponema sp.]|nr:hypothetical protein [Treponema sp.]